MFIGFFVSNSFSLTPTLSVFILFHTLPQALGAHANQYWKSAFVVRHHRLFTEWFDAKAVKLFESSYAEWQGSALLTSFLSSIVDSSMRYLIFRLRMKMTVSSDRYSELWCRKIVIFLDDFSWKLWIVLWPPLACANKTYRLKININCWKRLTELVAIAPTYNQQTKSTIIISDEMFKPWKNKQNHLGIFIIFARQYTQTTDDRLTVIIHTHYTWIDKALRILLADRQCHEIGTKAIYFRTQYALKSHRINSDITFFGWLRADEVRRSSGNGIENDTYDFFFHPSVSWPPNSSIPIQIIKTKGFSRTHICAT